MTAKPPPVPAGPFRFTRKQYHQLGDLGFFDGRRVELIFGEIIEMSPINWSHRVGCRKIADALEQAFAGVAWVDRAEPIDLNHSEPQPDVAVFAGRFEDYTDHPTTALLLVEVSDATLSKDLTTKAELYATAGIADYWVLDLNGRQLHVFRDPQPLPTGLGATAYRKHQILAPTESVTPLAAPTATIRVADLLP
jgi:Uma2 family endonuclease